MKITYDASQEEHCHLGVVTWHRRKGNMYIQRIGNIRANIEARLMEIRLTIFRDKRKHEL